VGRLVEEKGVLILLEACSQLLDCDWTLTVVGSGVLSGSMQKTVDGYGYSHRLTLLSGVKHSEVPGILASIDVFVLPSQRTSFWEEQFGLTLVQAMASGCACIGSDSGAIPYVLKDAGLIFRQRHVGELSVALRSLLESPDQRRRLGEAARRRALRYFSMEAVAKDYVELLNRYNERYSIIV
jgi:glycosyltransferase involved in cell wall biosynthesis